MPSPWGTGRAWGVPFAGDSRLGRPCGIARRIEVERAVRVQEGPAGPQGGGGAEQQDGRGGGIVAAPDQPAVVVDVLAGAGFDVAVAALHAAQGAAAQQQEPVQAVDVRVGGAANAAW